MVFYFTAMTVYGAKASKAVPKQKQQTTLGKITSESSKKMTIVNIRLDRKPEWKNLEMESHGTFLQLKLPQTITLNPGDFIEGNSPYIKKIAVYQSSDLEAVLRIFTDIKSDYIKDSSDLDILNNRLVLTVDHSAVKSFITKNKKSDHTKVALTKSETTANEALKPAQKLDPQSKSKVITSEPITAVNKEASNILDTPGSVDHSIEHYMKIATVFSISIIILGLLILTVRRILRNQKILNSPDGQIKLQKLNDLILAPKQKLSVIQVGNQQLLLSISPDSVSLITQLAGPATNASHAVEYVANSAIQRLPSTGQKPSKPVKVRSAGKGNDQAVEPIRKKEPMRKSSRKIASEPSTKREMVAKSSPRQRKKIQVSIDDAGINNQLGRGLGGGQENMSTEKAIDDVTKLIREKLKSLPKLS